MNHRSSPLLLSAALVGLLACPALAGYQLTDKDGDQTLVSNGRVKELSGEGGGPQSVFDLGLARAWMSNPDRGVYWEGTIDELCTTIRDTTAAIGKAMHDAMEAQLSQLSPENRAKVEELRKQLEANRKKEEESKASPGVVKVERTQQTETIAGQPTRKFNVLVDGALYEEDWLTTDPALAKEFALDRASELMSRVSACAIASDPDPSHPKGVDEGKIYQKLYPQGWPLKTVAHVGGKPRTKTEITKVEKRDVPDSEFKPPPGYRKAPLSEVMFSGMGGAPSTDL
jgi:uncharacterized protein DUF4412